jgi:hypothetical protein
MASNALQRLGVLGAVTAVLASTASTASATLTTAEPLSPLAQSASFPQVSVNREGDDDRAKDVSATRAVTGLPAVPVGSHLC